MCYTHADLQTDINDIYKAYVISNKNKKNYSFFIKGERINRVFIEKIFTFGMGIFNSLIFRAKLFDIHGQPTFFKKNMIKNINSLPDDFSIDTFLMIVALQKKIEIKRFNVQFKKRKHGEGSNEKITRKIIYSFKSIWSSLKILLFEKTK